MKMLVGYNGSPESQSALKQAGVLAKPLGASITVVTSMEGGPREKPEDISTAQEHLNDARDFMEQDGISCQLIQTARGLSPGEDIVNFAKENDIDLIIVGVEKRSKTQKILLGSTAQFIILKAPCPVLTVK